VPSGCTRTAATIAAALRALPVRSAILDGEGVIRGPGGVSDFDRMRAVFGRRAPAAREVTLGGGREAVRRYWAGPCASLLRS
jgi:hypothetical protein